MGEGSGRDPARKVPDDREERRRVPEAAARLAQKGSSGGRDAAGTGATSGCRSGGARRGRTSRSTGRWTGGSPRPPSLPEGANDDGQRPQTKEAKPFKSEPTTRPRPKARERPGDHPPSGARGRPRTPSRWSRDPVRSPSGEEGTAKVPGQTGVAKTQGRPRTTTGGVGTPGKERTTWSALTA